VGLAEAVGLDAELLDDLIDATGGDVCQAEQMLCDRLSSLYHGTPPSAGQEAAASADDGHSPLGLGGLDGGGDGGGGGPSPPEMELGTPRERVERWIRGWAEGQRPTIAGGMLNARGLRVVRHLSFCCSVGPRSRSGWQDAAVHWLRPPTLASERACAAHRSDLTRRHPLRSG
jgi:hypothetical protein